MNIQELADRVAALEELVRQRPIENDVLYTPAEIATLLRCGKTNVYDLIGAGGIAVTKVGANMGGLRVKGKDLLAFLDSRKEGGPVPRMAIRNARLRA